MAKVAITEQYLTDIADAIRTKTGLSNTFYPADMAPAILTISGSGGITPTGTITITENNTYDVARYASAVVNVPVGSTINNQNKTVTPTESSQSITADSGYTGLGTVTVGAISTTYVGSGVTKQAAKTITPTSSAQDAVAANVYTTGKITVAAVPTETKTVTVNGDVTPSTGKFLSKVTVNVPTGSTINNQDKTVNPSTTAQEIVADSGYTGLGTVTVNAMPTMTLPTTIASSATSGYTKKITIGRSTSNQYVNIPTGYNSTGAYYEISAVTNGTAGTPTASKGTVNNHSISVTPSVTNTTGYITGSTKTGTAVTVSASELVSGTLSVTSNGTKDVTNYASVNVNVSGDAPVIESLSVTPSESEQTFNSSEVTGYKPVTVGAISSTYVGSEITRRSSSDISKNTSTGVITIPSGYYDTSLSYELVTQAAKTVTPTESEQTAVAADRYTTGIVKVDAISSTYVGSGITMRSSTDLTVSGATMTAPAGYYAEAASKSVATMTLPTSAASSATSGYTSKATIGRSTAAQYINIPPGYNSAGAYYVISAVANGSATAPSSISGTAASISTGSGTLTLTKTVSVTPTVSAGYVSSGTAGNSSVSLTANVTINPTPTASGATVTIPAGYYSSQTTKSVSTGSATGPSTVSGTAASVSTGTNTLTLTKTNVSTTPTVSAGYVSSATASTATVTLTASVTTKAAATYHPSTTAQTIAASQYLTGVQTIAAVTTSNLFASNILSGVTIKVGDSSDDDCVASVTGNVTFQKYYTGSSAPSSSLGNNGDIYLQE